MVVLMYLYSSISDALATIMSIFAQRLYNHIHLECGV